MPANERYLQYFPDFDRDGKIWRYMEIDKFQKLIETSSIWLSGADQFDDTFEGSISEATRKTMPYGADVTPELIATFPDIHRRWMQWTFVTCWHYADVENALMWSAYAKKGVAVRSSFARLSAQLPDRTMAAPVAYRNYSTELVPEGTQFRYFSKRHFFKAEREVRGVLVDPPETPVGHELPENPDRGRSVQVDLSSLLEVIVARPFAPASEVDLLEKMVRDAGLKIPVQQSTLSGEPLLS